MPRWSTQEQECIDILKSRLSNELAASPQYPEIVGERKMVRFLRGHNFDIEKVYNMMVNFFKWRIDNNVNDIRTNIVERGFDHPSKFPKGDVILSLIPQLIIVPNAFDKLGSPLCVEQYNFVPSEVFKYITIDDYILFVMYSLEYRSLVIEQLSEHREQAFLAGLSESERVELKTDPNSKPYGVIVNTCVVRDLNGVGFAHLGPQGQDIIKAVITVASDNYPELMRKCFMINAPFIFNAVWYVIKGFLAPRTIAKVSMMGSGYLSELLQDIDFDSLPVMVGGGYSGFVTYEPFPFDLKYFVPGHCVPCADSSSDSVDNVDSVCGIKGIDGVVCQANDCCSSEFDAASMPPDTQSAVVTTNTSTNTATITSSVPDNCVDLITTDMHTCQVSEQSQVHLSTVVNGTNDTTIIPVTMPKSAADNDAVRKAPYASAGPCRAT